MKKVLSLILIITSSILFLVGCSKEQSTNTNSTKTITYEGTSYTVPSKPNRIVGLSNSILQILYAVDGTAVARVESTQPLPKEIQALPSVGHTATINMEQLMGLKPDLVIGLQAQHQKFKDQLESNKLPYILINYDGIKDNIPLLTFFGELTNHQDKAKEEIAKYTSHMDKVKQAVPKDKTKKVAVLRATGKAVTAETNAAITASMIEELGIPNVVTAHGNLDKTAKTVPYSLETLAIDNPDVILVVTMGKKEEIDATFKKEMSNNPAWQNLNAVKNDKVVFLPSNLFLLNPGIQTPEAMAQLVKIIYDIDVTF